MQQWRGQVHDMGMVLPRRALIPGQGTAFLLGSVLAQPLLWLMGRTGRLYQFRFLLRRVFQLVKICLFLASHIVSAPQALSH